MARQTCEKLSKIIKKDQMIGILPDSDLDCSINVGIAEAKKELQFEHLIKEAESRLENVCFLS